MPAGVGGWGAGMISAKEDQRGRTLLSIQDGVREETETMQFSCYSTGGETGELGSQEQEESHGSVFSLFVALGEAGLEVLAEFGVMDKAMSSGGRFKEDNV